MKGDIVDEITTQTPNDTPNPTPDEVQTEQTLDPLQNANDLAAKYAEQSLVEDDPLNPEQEVETETTTEAPVETQTTQQTPTQVQEPVQEVEEDEFPQMVQAPGVQPIDYSKFVDENGLLDVKALGEAQNAQMQAALQTATAQARNAYQNELRETREWTKAVEQYPALKTNKALRDMVENARIGNATEQYQKAGNNPELLARIRVPSPLQVAKTIFDYAGTAKDEAIKQVTENVKIQETAYVETASTPVQESKNEQLYKKIGDPRDPIGAQQAQRDLLKSLLFKD